jgi:hypothetical protein
MLLKRQCECGMSSLGESDSGADGFAPRLARYQTFNMAHINTFYKRGMKNQLDGLSCGALR